MKLNFNLSNAWNVKIIIIWMNIHNVKLGNLVNVYNINLTIQKNVSCVKTNFIYSKILVNNINTFQTVNFMIL